MFKIHGSKTVHGVHEHHLAPEPSEDEHRAQLTANGVDVDHLIESYDAESRLLRRRSVDLHGLANVPQGKGPKLRGRWRLSGGKWRPVDTVARNQAKELGIEELAA
jgi:hypothetical protein